MPHQDQGAENTITTDQSLPPGVGPGWKGNLLLFGVLILVVLAYFSWQANKTHKGFLKRVSTHSQMLAGMLSSSLNNAQSSEDSIEKTIHTFLTSTARFTDYLDSIKSFNNKELAEVVEQANLAGLKIIHFTSPDIEAPQGWSPDVACQPTADSLLHFPDKNLYMLILPREEEPGCILVGFDSSDTVRLMEKIGVERLLEDMTNLPLIQYARLEKAATDQEPITKPEVHLIRKRNNNIVETRMPFADNKLLVVGRNANRYVQRIDQFKHELIMLSVLLICLGAFFSWLLHRYQTAFIGKVTSFERQMAKQHEEAALGRATAAISHEIKNPLNAIGMGLQRLQMEVELSGEYNKLVSSMRQAVKRTNNIISDLKQHTLKISPEFKDINPQNLIEAALALNDGNFKKKGIVVHLEDVFSGLISGDEGLLGQVLENLLKNAVEAQPNGGYIQIKTAMNDGMFMLSLENLGLAVEEAEVATILEPYFTSKTKGTGLGLAICKRIIEAHNGTIRLEVPEHKVLRISIIIPITKRLEQ